MAFQATVPPPEQTSANRILLRTQSLGSVETWHLNSESPDGRESVDDNRSKCKEKEWYETSLDSRCSPNPVPNPHPRTVRRASQHNPQASGPRERVLTGREPMRSNSIGTNRRVREQLPHMEEQPPRSQFLQNRYETPRVLEIPAESKPLQENGNEQMLNSPPGHTVLQPGKYQPYREVTKPFEMSDFYKYSTKFRKRAEMSAGNEQQSPTSPTLSTSTDQPLQNNSLQKRIHQPVQRNSCQSYALR